MDVAKLKNVDKLKYFLNATLTVRVPEDLLTKARAKSDLTGISLSHVVRQALEKWVKEKE